MSSNLGRFEGRNVAASSVAITGAGAGLSNALTIDPQAFKTGEKVYLVLECEVSNITHKPIKGVQDFNRVHTLATTQATIVDADLVLPALNAQAEKFAAAQADDPSLLDQPDGE